MRTSRGRIVSIFRARRPTYIGNRSRITTASLAGDRVNGREPIDVIAGVASAVDEATIEIFERHAQPLGQQRTDGALARTSWSDKRD